MWRVKVATAEYYVRLLSENVKKGQGEKIKQGGFPTKPPPGYKTVGEKGHKTHIPDDDKRILVKEMFDLYATGDYSVKKLTEVMYEKGLRNANGNKIWKSRIHQLLSHPFYIGKMKWNDVISDGTHDAIIDDETFSKVQSLLKSRNTPKYNKHFYLFKQLIKCAECVGTITWEAQKGIIYGHCNHYRNCNQKAWPTQEEVEIQLINEFDKLTIKNKRIAGWIRNALKESHKDKIYNYSASVNELTNKEKQLNQRIERIYEDKLDGKISETFYNTHFQKYTAELKEVEKSIQKHNTANIKYYELGSNLYDLSQRAKEIYLKANQDQRRQLIMLVFEKLTLDEEVLGYSFAKPFKILSEAINFTNRSSKMAENKGLEENIFEPIEKHVIASQSGHLLLARPNWLPIP